MTKLLAGTPTLSALVLVLQIEAAAGLGGWTDLSLYWGWSSLHSSSTTDKIAEAAYVLCINRLCYLEPVET